MNQRAEAFWRFFEQSGFVAVYMLYRACLPQ